MYGVHIINDHWAIDWMFVCISNLIHLSKLFMCVCKYTYLYKIMCTGVHIKSQVCIEFIEYINIKHNITSENQTTYIDHSESVIIHYIYISSGNKRTISNIG